MAKKKKPLQQLDMFSLFAETEQAPEKEVAVEEILPEPLPIEEPAIENIVAEEAIAIQPTQDTNFIFNDGKIGIKIKQKPLPIMAEETFIEPVEEVKEPIKPVKQRIPKPKVERPDALRKRGRKSFKEMDSEVDLINVPDEATLSKKLYYSIGEVAKFFNVNPSVIRAWDVEFDILQPRKNRKGDRFFRVEDIKNLEMIYFLLRSKKLSVDGAKAYLKSNRKGADTNFQILQSLQKFRGFLLELKANLGA